MPWNFIHVGVTNLHKRYTQMRITTKIMLENVNCQIKVYLKHCTDIQRYILRSKNKRIPKKMFNEPHCNNHFLIIPA